MKMLSQLRLVDWIILCLGLSVIGSILATLVLVARDVIALGEFSYFLAKPNLILLAANLIYMVLGCLLVNALGALFLLAFFAFKRRVQAS